MAGPTYVNSGALAAPGGAPSTISPALPASIVAGNLLVAQFACLSTNRDASFPAGWTRINIIQSAGDYSLVFGARIADGVTDGTDVLITAAGSGQLRAQVHQFTGNASASVGAAIVDSAATVNGNGATFTNPGITTTAANSLAVCLWAGNNGSVSGTPTGYTQMDSNTFLASFFEAVASSGGTSDAISQAMSASMRYGSYSFEIKSGGGSEADITATMALGINEAASLAQGRRQPVVCVIN